MKRPTFSAHLTFNRPQCGETVISTISQQPYHPILYVRGFAATQGEIEESVADPYMGFNIGSTKARG